MENRKAASLLAALALGRNGQQRGHSAQETRLHLHHCPCHPENLGWQPPTRVTPRRCPRDSAAVKSVLLNTIHHGSRSQIQLGTALWNCIEGAAVAGVLPGCHGTAWKFCCLQLQVWEIRSIATKAFESNGVAVPMGYCKESISDSDTLSCLLGCGLPQQRGAGENTQQTHQPCLFPQVMRLGEF